MDQDGDTGTNISKITNIIKFNLISRKINTKQWGKLFYDLREILEDNMLGTLGPLYTVAFEAAGNIFMRKSDDCKVNGFIWIEVLESVIDVLIRFGGVNIGDKTMVDSMEGALSKLKDLNEDSLANNLLLVAKALAEGAEAGETSTMSTYVKRRSSLAGGSKYPRDPDPGAHVVAVWMRAIYEGYKTTIT